MAILEFLDRAKRQRTKTAQKQVLKNVAIGVVVGTAVGAAAGVLLAPKAGKETREELAIAALEVVEQVKEKAEEIKVKVKQRMEECTCGCEKTESAVAELPTDNEKNKS